jgi:signal transduction histidine kinase
MEEQIRTYQKELHSVTSEMLSLETRIEERERNLIAADLHDFVGQNLLALKFKLNLLRRSLSSPESIGQLEDLRDIIEQTIQHTRSLTIELSPPILVELGLKDAVEDLADGFGKTYGIRVVVEDDGHPKPIDDNARYLLFRCVRELLVNVVKHSKADTVKISLTRANDNFQIIIADNGIGFDTVSATGKNKRFGLFTIRDRMRRLGGHCEIETERGVGTKVILVSPTKL